MARTGSVTAQDETYVVAAKTEQAWIYCNLCPRKYRSVGALQRHATYECGQEKSFSCPHCQYKAQRKDHLDSHVRRKHADKRCEQCLQQI